MNRKAFLLGLLSIGGQTLLLKELISSLNGDELFIGTALFGWLISIALGAYLGGRRLININSGPLFFAGVILLPLMILATRFCPMIVISTVGEIVPFATASLISVVMMIPLGLVSGWLFPIITHEGHRPAASIARVYLFEGVGAFIGGIVVAALAGSIYSTLGAALAIGAVVIGMYYLPAKIKGIMILSSGLLLILLMVWFVCPLADRYFDQIKYDAYKVEKTFDTHYGHQTILSRDDAITLLTDNKVEATYPDLYQAENLLLPPLAYKPESKNILYVGRTELGISQLAAELPSIKVTALDPREVLSIEIDKFIPASYSVVRVHDDQLSYFTGRKLITKYDIIIINPGELDNYKSCRLLNDMFLSYTKLLLKPDGILYYPSYYDSDRYIGSEKEEILSIINNSLRKYFIDTYQWPGEMTLFFASDKPFEKFTPDSIAGLIESTGYQSRFLTETFIADRLNDIKSDRLNKALISSTITNSTDKPILVYKHLTLRSMTSKTDQRLIAFLFEESIWVLSVPFLIIIFFFITILRNHRRRNYGLFLYFIAGIVSIILELVSFYLYQTSAGSLYSELAVLIGVFMLGLALGTYYSCRIDRENLEFPALLLMLTSAVLFFATYNKIGMNTLLYYHILFLFTMALATGSLFVAATDRFYFGKSEANRGTGYTFEILGSAIGALIATTILLPLIGIYWLLISIIILITLTLLGAVLTVK